MIWDKRIRLKDGTVILPEQVNSINFTYGHVAWSPFPFLERTDNILGATFERGFQHGEEWWYEGDVLEFIETIEEEEPYDVPVRGTLRFSGQMFYVEAQSIYKMRPELWHLVKEVPDDKRRGNCSRINKMVGKV
jgi:hypothetical protein